MVETAILGGISGIQTPLSGALNTFTPVRGATTVVNQVVVAEKPTDIPGEWNPVGMPITGVTTMVFYKRRDVLITANVFKSAGRAIERTTDQVKKGISTLTTKISSKPKKSGYINFEKSQRAQEKHEELKERIKAKRYKCRCLVPIDVNYTLQAYLGLPPEYVKKEKEDQEAYDKAKKDYDSNPFTNSSQMVNISPPKIPDKFPRYQIFLFTNARADIGTGLDNSLGENLTFTISLIPKWDNKGRRYLNIGWKASGGGMKFSKGFEHSGTAVAILDVVTAISPYGDKYEQLGLVPADRQDEQTEHHFLRGAYGRARQPKDGEDPDVEYADIPELEGSFEELPVGNDEELYGKKKSSSTKQQVDLDDSE